MRRLHCLAILFPLTFVVRINGYTKPCIYQAEKCGYTLIAAYGYTVNELIAAVNQTASIPPITSDQLAQVIFHCENIYGALIGNSFCFNGCLDSRNPTMDDDCRVAGNGSAPGTVTVTATTTSISTSTLTVTSPGNTTTTTVTSGYAFTCFTEHKAWCFGGSNTSYMDSYTLYSATATAAWLTEV
ncbi:hypothetical protein N7495_006255 [Penicillium taxi]|uniref:uncharacterized protein n=1 Tax=Penicillium taxi TaxID=168475 RepID=UPI0025453787|nr:uncharacterized protein N7495_006255 [Penicillium taxi]KAJ5894564.1 hypothetical protein N7495_006255 [Penicillium taxi]